MLLGLLAGVSLAKDEAVWPMELWAPDVLGADDWFEVDMELLDEPSSLPLQALKKTAAPKDKVFNFLSIPTP